MFRTASRMYAEHYASNFKVQARIIGRVPSPRAPRVASSKYITANDHSNDSPLCAAPSAMEPHQQTIFLNA